MQFWLVFKWVDATEKGQVTEFQGLFDSEEKAVAACRDWRYFIAPAELNKELPEQTAEWPGVHYPIAREE